MQMRKPLAIGSVTVLAVLTATLFGPAQAPPSSAPLNKSFKEAIEPLAKQHCWDCHAGESPEAEIALDGDWDLDRVRNEWDTWERVVEMLDSRQMPPKPNPQPPEDQRLAALEWLRAALAETDKAPDPGRVTLRRLNRVQYANTIRDLLGVELDTTQDFPADDVGYGFDNIGDVLSLPPILMEKYMAAAEQIATRAVVVDPIEASPAQRLEADDLEGGSPRGEYRALPSQGEIAGDFDAPAETEYLIRVTAYGDQAGNEPARGELRIDGDKRQTFDIAATAADPQVYEYRATLAAGKHRIALAFINDYYNPEAADPNQRDRNLAVGWIELIGPLIRRPEDYPESHRRILFVQPGGNLSETDAARQILKRLADRAFRRPATEAEVDRLAGLVTMVRRDGGSFEEGVRLALEAVLCSPHFLFMVERDPAEGESIRPLDDYELATRLSYFLWSSMPDEELFGQAERGTLRGNLEGQVRRMLADPKAEALVENFAEQWFQLRNLEKVTPDEKQFGPFDDALRRDMETETRMYFAAILREDRSMLDLIGGDFTFLNERLARHYGIEGVAGEEFRRVSLAGTPRGGVLTQASVLTVTSNPTRTSPVKRGKWIMENLLGTPPPDPPPDVPMLDTQTQLTGSLRQRMEQHRADPQCAVCHEKMDPLGFAMENFDAVGRWRTMDGEYPIDASGTLPDGTSFDGPAGLKKILLDSGRDQFARCVAEKTLTYALGRGVEPSDKAYVDQIVQAFSEDQYKFSSLVLAVVQSDPFQKRGGVEKE